MEDAIATAVIRLIEWKEALVKWLTTSETRFLVFALIVGTMAGLVAHTFHSIIKFMSQFTIGDMESIAALSWYQRSGRALFPALGGLLVGLIFLGVRRSQREQGVPHVIHALHRRGGTIDVKPTILKSIGACLTIGSGGSAGPEGPIAEIGGATGSFLGRIFKVPEHILRMLVAGGAAGGIAASFHAPIGGVIFALEIILAEFTPQAFSLVVLSSVTATIVSRALSGGHAYFSVPIYDLGPSWELLLFSFLGICAGLFSKIYVLFLDGTEKLFREMERVSSWIRPALGGIVVGGLALLTPQVLGSGHKMIEQALWGQLSLHLLVALLLAKLVATSVTLGSGGVGGVFLPGFYVGAMMGGAFGFFAKFGLARLGIPIISSVGAFSFVGMAALLAGSTRAPMTAVIIIFEITNDYHMILPVMISTVLATMIARSIESQTIYTRKLKEKGIREQAPQYMKPLEIRMVRDVMTKKVVSISPSLPLAKLVRMVETKGHSGFPVVDENKELVGLVTFEELRTALGVEDLPKDVIVVGDIMKMPAPFVYEDQALSVVLERLSELSVDRLPVVERKNPTRLIGMVTQRDIIGVYYKLLREAE